MLSDNNFLVNQVGNSCIRSLLKSWRDGSCFVDPEWYSIVLHINGHRFGIHGNFTEFVVNDILEISNDGPFKG